MIERLDRSRLRGFERVAVPLFDAINHNPRLKMGVQSTIGVFNGLWIRRYTGKVWQVEGAQNLEGLDAPYGMIIAANHRSFFDLYVCCSYLVNHHRDLLRRLYCPVRTDFFYTRPLGSLLNLAISGGSMWPPIFRDDRGRSFNTVALAQLASQMAPGSIVGMHPEGRRSTGDPYELLSPKPGLGILIKECHPDTLVLPYFSLGLENSLGELIKRNRKPVGERGTPVTLRFGECMRAGDIIEGRSAAAATKFVMERIHDLGQADKELREHLGPA